MAVIKGNIDPYWHESNLIILTLNRGSLWQDELFKTIKEEQQKRTIFGEKEITHSESAYKYWVKKRENHWIISRYGDKLELTPLGRWIANSELGTFFNRADFVELVCYKCSEPANLALLKPLPDTAETNAKGRLFMDVKCPRCQYSINRLRMSEDLTKDQFISFYNHAVGQLQRIIEIKTCII
jgi:hypothetical protein